jgi:hypothetical protein
LAKHILAQISVFFSPGFYYTIASGYVFNMNSRLLTAAAVFLTLASGALDLPGLPDPQSGRSGQPFNILQTNEEDGTASNIQTFYNTLTDAGCSSIVSATKRGVVGVENFVETWEPEPDPVSPHKCVGDSCPPLPSPTSNARDELHHDPSTTKRIHVSTARAPSFKNADL